LIGLFPLLSGSSGYIYYKAKEPNHEKMVLILDMDETFLYAQRKSSYEDSNNSNALEPTYEINFDDEKGKVHEGYHIWLRPGVALFLPILASYTNLYMYTTGTTRYAKKATAVTGVDKYFLAMKCREDRAEYKAHHKKTSGKDITGKPFDIFDDIKPDQLVLLVDDKKNNYWVEDASQPNRLFYHIPKFNKHTSYDCEFFKLFGYVLYLNMKKDGMQWKEKMSVLWKGKE